MADTENMFTKGPALSEVAAATLTPAEPTSDEETVEEEEQLADSTDEQTDDDTVEETEDDTEGSDEDTEVEADVYAVTVDGEEHEVSLTDLVTSYQMRSAAQKRLGEASIIRKTAEEEGRKTGMESAKVEIDARQGELNRAYEQVQTTLQALAPMFQPSVQPPDPDLMETDPIGYMKQKDQHDREVARIQGLQQHVNQVQTEAARNVEAERQRIRAEQGRLLRAEREDLQTEDGQRVFTSRVRAAQNAVGFSQEEVDAYPDARGLKILEMAGLWLESQGALAEDSPAAKVVRKAKKTLKPGAVRRVRSEKQKAQRANRDRAKQSGDYRDVAKTLIQPSSR